jgi:large subunit ribosomal protein L21
MTQTSANTSPADAVTPSGGSAAEPVPYAIVESSGQQFWLQPNRYYDVDRLAADVDSTVTLENVLLVNDGNAATLGQPYVAGASVELKVMEHRRGPKLIVYKMRPKKKTRRKNGHRQELTRVMVQSIKVAGKTLG